MNIKIDGKSCACEPGEYLLDIAARNGIKIPALCHHEGLPGQGCCRVCIVEVESRGHRSIVTACVYPVEQECDVSTDSDRVKRQRGMVLSLLRSRAPESAEIASLCEEYGAPAYGRFDKKTGEKCILCGLCVKACESLGTGAISTVNRGVEKAVSTPYDEPAADCAGCGSCAGICPTGAIAAEEDDLTRTIWNKRFELQLCERCRKPAGTSEELRLATKRAGTEPSALCAECRRKAIADALAMTYGLA